MPGHRCGIGQSRVGTYFLRKARVGEIQASHWPDELLTLCRRNKMPRL